MSKSKRTPVLAPEAARKNRIRSVFQDGEGHVRLGWLLAASLLGYFLLDRVLFVLLSLAFLRLFSVWNLTLDNYIRAPGWAQLIFRSHQGMISVVVSLAIIGLSAALARLWKASSKADSGLNRSLKPSLSAFFAGFCAAVAFYLLFVLTDSYRVDWQSALPQLPLVVLSALILALRLFAEALFTKRVIMDGLRKRGHARLALIFAGVWMALTHYDSIANVISAVNWLLLGLLIGLLYLKFELFTGLGLYLGWQWGQQLGFGFTSGTQTSVCRLYAISEVPLTGGDGGMLYGFGMTALLAAGILLLTRRNLRRFWVGFRKTDQSSLSLR